MFWFLGFSHPTTISPSSYVTPYTPLNTDEAEATTELKEGEPVKIQLGAQIDGFGSIVCDTILVPAKDKAQDEITGKPADLLLANYYAMELLLRLMIPPGTLAQGTEEEKAKAAARFKAKGNAAYQQRQFSTAADLYTKAIELSPKAEPVYFSNRAACPSSIAESVE